MKPTHIRIDSVYLLLFNISKRSFIPVIDFAERADQKIHYTVPATENGEFVAWAFATNRDNTNSSNSQFLGKFKMETSEFAKITNKYSELINRNKS